MMDWLKFPLHAIKYNGRWALCKNRCGEWYNLHSDEMFCYVGAEEKAVTLE